MSKRIIKITEAQLESLKKVIMEAPFSYLGNETSNTNHSEEVFANTPNDSPDHVPVNTTTDDVAGALSNRAWWCRRI
jgi:hypothetical protein